jgi:glycosidase
MGDVEVPADESIDAPAARVAPDFPWWDRSQSRTPMAWSAEPGAGFTSAERPWLRFGPDVASRNVASESGDPGSVLQTYRRLIRARRETRALQDGELHLMRGLPDDVLGYRRTACDGSPSAVVLVAFGHEAVEVPLPRPARGRWHALVGTRRQPAVPSEDGRGITLRPLEGVVLVDGR